VGDGTRRTQPSTPRPIAQKTFAIQAKTDIILVERKFTYKTKIYPKKV